jgi:hypothetical protein
MTANWRTVLKADPVPWLLELENPAVRYGTLVDILDRPIDDPQVRAARAAIAGYPPVAELLVAQKPDGYWVKRDYYLPKHCGTFWLLTLLADLGLSVDNEQVRRACEFMFAFQRERGAFCRFRRVAGKGMVWDTGADPCTHARIVRFLIQFGYGNDPRTRAAVDWLLAEQREDGMWHCGAASRPGCLRATLDVLRVAAIDAATAAHPAISNAAEVVCDMLEEPRLGRYHVGHEWTDLEVPPFGYGLVPTLESLGRLGYKREVPNIAAKIEYLFSRQLASGAWVADQMPYRLPFDMGRPGEPNKWLTLDALRAVRPFFGL